MYFKHIHLIVYHRYSVGLKKNVKSLLRSCKNTKQKETWPILFHLKLKFYTMIIITCVHTNLYDLNIWLLDLLKL